MRRDYNNGTVALSAVIVSSRARHFYENVAPYAETAYVIYISGETVFWGCVYMKIYTKTGDKGETGLWGGGRIGKDSVRITAYGTVDECNALLGIVRTFDLGRQLDDMLAQIQNQLFVVGSDLATPGDQETAISRVSQDSVRQLERWIDQLEESLPSIKRFILPGGSKPASYLHLARTVCRRAERWAVTLLRDEPAAEQAAIYLNRLSDLLFVAARTANLQAGIDDRFWDKANSKKQK